MEKDLKIYITDDENLAVQVRALGTVWEIIVETEQFSILTVLRRFSAYPQEAWEIAQFRDLDSETQYLILSKIKKLKAQWLQLIEKK